MVVHSIDFNNVTQASRVGIVKFVNTSGEGKRSIKLTEVLHVPNTHLNIWSARKLAQKGLEYHFDPKESSNTQRQRTTNYYRSITE